MDNFSWILENATTVRDLATAVLAPIGLALLWWRSAAANRAANASLEQARTTAARTEALVSQADASMSQAKVALEQAELNSKQHLTQLLTEGIKFLDSDRAATRLAGIQVLERVMELAPAEKFTILRLLQELIHDAVPDARGSLDDLPQEARKHLESKKVREILASRPEYIYVKSDVSTEIAYAVRVLGRRSDPGMVSLSETRLRASNLGGLDFSGSTIYLADLTGSHCIQTNFQKSMLFGTNFSGVNANFADFEGADMRSVNLSRANLENASLRKANLEGASFHQAKLSGTDLRGTNLTDTSGLTQSQIHEAKIDSETILPSA